MHIPWHKLREYFWGVGCKMEERWDILQSWVFEE